MLTKDLTKVWISEHTTINDHGEKEKKWKYKGIAWLNLQQDRKKRYNSEEENRELFRLYTCSK